MSVNNDLTAWRTLLQQAAAPLENSTPHQYITDTADQQHTITANPTLPNRKLSIEEIVATSISVIESSRKEHNSNFVKVRTDIADLTEKLIEARVNKRKKYAFLRSVARVICLLTSFTGVSYLLYVKLKEEDAKFNADITKLNDSVEAAVKRDKTAQILTKNSFRAMQDAGIDDAAIQQLFQNGANTRFAAERSRVGVVGQFAADIRRGYQFQINDPQAEHINSATVYPSQELPPEERVTSAVEVLHQINSPEWEIAIQCACNQMPLTSSIGPIIALFMTAGLDQMRWTEGGNSYGLLAAQQQKEHPFAITVIRNQLTNEIESVQFAVEKSIDIKLHNFTDGTQMVTEENAITGRVTYTLTLDEQRRPLIQDLHLETVVNLGENAEQDQNAIGG